MMSDAQISRGADVANQETGGKSEGRAWQTKRLEADEKGGQGKPGDRRQIRRADKANQ